MPDDSLPDLDIFLNAPAEATDEELKIYLDEACGSDDGLRQRVESLFAADLTATRTGRHHQRGRSFSKRWEGIPRVGDRYRAGHLFGWRTLRS